MSKILQMLFKKKPGLTRDYETSIKIVINRKFKKI